MTLGERLRHLLQGGLNVAKMRALPVRAWRALRGGAIVPVAKLLLVRSATRYRSQLRNVVFIGVTGSCGKTTTRELIAAVLSSQFKGKKSPGNRNLPAGIAKTILSVRPWDNFCVVEIAAAIRGERVPLERSLGLVKPQIAVVTNIGTDHIQAFQSMEAIAAEKGKLVEAVPPHGTAVLNADDANVLAMQARCGGRVITYGLSPAAMVRAENVRCAWPERLSFTVLYDGQSYAVQTQLCGTHWVSCVLAAIAVGLVMGVDPAIAVEAIKTVPPFERRMHPVSRPDGVTFIEDVVKAPFWTIAPTLEFMKAARARRKIMVFGTISDYQGKSDQAYVSVARQALDVADHVVFVGSRASKCRKAKRYPQDDSLRDFYGLKAVTEYLHRLLQPGDLVLLKGSERDHFAKIVPVLASMERRRHVQQEGEPGPRESWRSRDILVAGSLEGYSSVGNARRRFRLSAPRRPIRADQPAQVVVGLGNPGMEYHGTPHNVGHQTLDILAQSLGGVWTRQNQAMVALVEWRGQTVYLIKPLTYMNATGSVLVQLGDRFGFGPAECVLVHDDIYLPPGVVRVRMRGGDGGHRGVRSVLEAFSTDAFCRVKIGVGRSKQGNEQASHILTAFSPTEVPVIERACAEASDRVLEMVMSLRTKIA